MADFSRCIKSGSPAEFYYCETNSMNTINSVVREDFNLGIVRYQASYEKYFSDLFKDKKLTSETVAEFTYVLLISKNNPLTQREEVYLDDLAEYIEVCHADPYVPSVPMIDVRKSELTEFIDRRIYVYERGTQFAEQFRIHSCGCPPYRRSSSRITGWFNLKSRAATNHTRTY